MHKKKADISDFITKNRINFHFFINPNNIHTLIRAIKRFKSAKKKTLVILNKLFYFQIEQKKLWIFILD